MECKLVGGIANEIWVLKFVLESVGVTIEDVKKELKKVVDLELYDLHEEDMCYLFTLRPEGVTIEDITGFILEQYRLYSMEEAEYLEYGMYLKGFRDVRTLFESSKSEPRGVIREAVVNMTIKTVAWNAPLHVGMKLMTYLAEKRFSMECDYNYLRYIEACIRASSKYKISGALMFGTEIEEGDL